MTEASSYTCGGQASISLFHSPGGACEVPLTSKNVLLTMCNNSH